MRVYDHRGTRFGTWTVVDMIIKHEKKFYRLRCECGYEKLVPSQKIYRRSVCEKCKPKLEHDSHIGEKHGKITCLGYIKKGNRHGYLIQCDCERKYTVASYHQFLAANSCKPCSKGYYPGKKIGNVTFLENMHKGKWKIQCVCGKIFIGRTSKRDCGCISKNKILDLANKKIGVKYHFLTVKGINSNKNGHIQLLVQCKCGKQLIRDNGHEFKSRSCGCEFSVPIGENASNATLKNCEVISIRELHLSGLYSIHQLAQMFKKRNTYINRIVSRKIWKHI